MLTHSTVREGAYDEALIRFHATGPEFEGWLSNHGPMAVEALARAGEDDHIHGWVDHYLTRLDERPRAISPISAEKWREPLGDPVRTGDWINFFLGQVRELEWRELLATWWPRLLPGIAAGATHGVIRVGHAVVALEDAHTQPRLDEFAHALAYWAARWQPVPVVGPSGTGSFEATLEAIPAIARQESGIRTRLAQLDEEFASAAASADPGVPGNEVDTVERIADAAVRFYATHAHGNPTMLVHAATAPNAVARVLPLLPVEQHRISVDAAWTATCAVVAAYRPSTPNLAAETTADPGEVMAHAVAGGDEHAIKFADTAIRSFERTGDTSALTAALLATNLLDED